MAHDVFVSYSAKDKAVAAQVVAHLEAASIRCWMAPRDVVPGADWGESIIDAIESSRVMVLIFSRNANASQQIKREVERAVDKDVYTIPLRIDDIEPTRSLEYFISSSQWMDAFTPPLDQHFDKLADTVKAILARREDDSTATTAEPEPTRTIKTREEIPPPHREQSASRRSIAIVAAVVIVAVGAAAFYFAGRTNHASAPIASVSATPITTPAETASPPRAESDALRENFNTAKSLDFANVAASPAPPNANMNSKAATTPEAPLAREDVGKELPPVAVFGVTPNAKTTREEDPAAVVRRYYESINRRAQQDAYEMLSTGFKARHSAEGFAQIFADTASVEVREIQTLSNSENTALVSAALLETDSQQRSHKWNRNVYLIKEDGAWKIDRTTANNEDAVRKGSGKKN